MILIVESERAIATYILLNKETSPYPDVQECNSRAVTKQLNLNLTKKIPSCSKISRNILEANFDADSAKFRF
jgi:hypothetical protein